MNATAPAKNAAKALGLALAVVLVLSGCSFAANITTMKPYAPSDGVRVEVGGVHAQNLLIVVPAEGDEAVLIGSLTNESTDAVGVELTQVGQGASASVKVDGSSTVRLGTEDERTLRVAVDSVKPGSLTEVRIAVDGTQTATLTVPVVDGTLPEYRDLF